MAKVINLKSKYESLIHIPTYTVNNGGKKFPLYGTTTGDNTDNDNRNIVDTDNIASIRQHPDLVKLSEEKYNSPTNVRRLVITRSKVIVELYKPYIVKHSENKAYTGGCILEHKVDSEVDTAFKNILNYYSQGQNTDMAYGPKLEYKLSGKPLVNIRNPWVLANIEEVYIDAVMLLSDDLFTGDDKYKVVSKMRSKALNELGSTNEIIWKCLSKTSDTSPEVINKQFRRLRCVGIIMELNEIVNAGKLNLASIGNNTCIDYLTKMRLVNERTSIVQKFPADILGGENPKFAVRPYYKFDKNVLFEYSKKLQRELAKNSENSDNSKDINSISQNSKCDFEKTLDSYEESLGNKLSMEVLAMTIAVMSKDDRLEAYSKLTEEGKKKYGPILLK